MARTRKSTYLVRDPQGVYENQLVEVPFDLPVSSMKPQSIGAAKATIVRVLAIEAMYGCPLSEVDPAHVRDMLRSVTIDGPVDEPVGDPDPTKWQIVTHWDDEEDQTS